MDLETTDFLARVQIHKKIIELEAVQFEPEKRRQVASSVYFVSKYEGPNV
jgi:hypothetical protein